LLSRFESSEVFELYRRFGEEYCRHFRGQGDKTVTVSPWSWWQYGGHATGWTVKELLLNFGREQEIFFCSWGFCTRPDRPRCPPNPSLQWVQWTVSPGLKWTGREADQSPSFSAEIKKHWSSTPIPHSPISFHAVRRDNFAFTRPLSWWSEEQPRWRLPALALVRRKVNQCSADGCHSNTIHWVGLLSGVLMKIRYLKVWSFHVGEDSYCGLVASDTV
jgi:hypothetical protein